MVKTRKLGLEPFERVDALNARKRLKTLKSQRIRFKKVQKKIKPKPTRLTNIGRAIVFSGKKSLVTKKKRQRQVNVFRTLQGL